jgi:hypothetical protein
MRSCIPFFNTNRVWNRSPRQAPPSVLDDVLFTGTDDMGFDNILFFLFLIYF